MKAFVKISARWDAVGNAWRSRLLDRLAVKVA
jgi:hypothetical protein